MEEEEEEGGEESGEESGEEVEEGGGEEEGEKKRKGKRKRRGLCIHVSPCMQYSLAFMHGCVTCMLVNTCCVLHVVDDQLDEDDLELIKENTGVDIQVVGWQGLVCVYVHITTPYAYTEVHIHVMCRFGTLYSGHVVHLFYVCVFSEPRNCYVYFLHT